MEPPSSPLDSPPAPVAELEQRLGMGLADPTTALAALTHKSYVNEHRGEGLQDNERLEFLGDAVIDLAVSHRLMERFPGAREGELSKIRASVVDEAGLAQMARELDLGSLLRLGRGEELTGGRQKSSLLADAMEAVVAALYLGGGLAPVLALVDRFLGEAFARAAAGTLDRDYKTQFQELAQSRLRASPRYRVVGERGPDHSKVFEVELELRGEVVGRGEGRSKKDAEQGAARCALEAMNGRLAAAAEPGGDAPSAAPAVAAPGDAAEVVPSASRAPGPGGPGGALEAGAGDAAAPPVPEVTATPDPAVAPSGPVEPGADLHADRSPPPVPDDAGAREPTPAEGPRPGPPREPERGAAKRAHRAPRRASRASRASGKPKAKPRPKPAARGTARPAARKRAPKRRT